MSIEFSKKLNPGNWQDSELLGHQMIKEFAELGIILESEAEYGGIMQEIGLGFTVIDKYMHYGDTNFVQFAFGPNGWTVWVPGNHRGKVTLDAFATWIGMDKLPEEMIRTVNTPTGLYCVFFPFPTST